MNKNRAGIERSFVCPNPKLEVTFALINQWLANPSLSYKNCLLAAKWVATARDLPSWQTVEDQKQLNFLDERVAAAKERVQRREEKREAKKADAAGLKPGRKLKNTPTPDPPAIDVWSLL